MDFLDNYLGSYIVSRWGFLKKVKKVLVRGLQFTALTVFVCYFLIWSLSPFVVRHYLAGFLDGYNIELSGRSVVRYNPFVSDLVIRDVVFLKEEEVVLSIDKADIEIDAYRLLMDNIHIKNFSMENVDVAVDITENKIIVAGFELPKEKTDTEDAGASVKSQFPFLITAPDLSILKSHVSVNHHGIPHSLLIKTISVHDVSVTDQRQQLQLDAAVSLMGGEFILSSIVDVVADKGTVTSRVSLKKLILEELTPELSGLVKSLAGDLSLTLSPIIDFDTETTRLRLEDSTVTVQDFSAEVDSVYGAFDELTIKLDDVALRLSDGGALNVQSRGDLTLNNVRVQNPANNATYLQWGSLSLSAFSLTADQDYLESTRVDISRIILNKLFGSHIGGEDALPPLVGIDKVLIENFAYAGGTLSIADVGLSNIAGHVLIAEDGVLATLIKPAMSISSDNETSEIIAKGTGEKVDNDMDNTSVNDPSSSVETYTGNAAGNDSDNNTVAERGKDKEKSKTENIGDSKSEFALKIALNKLSVSGDNQIHFHDKSVTPNYERVIYLDTFEISDINSDSDSLSPFKIEGRSNEYTKFQFSGGIAPFSGVKNLALKGSVNELSLPAVSAYIKDALGFELKSGQLDAKLDVSVTNSKLDGKIKLDLRGLDMTAANDDAVGSLKDQTFIPLNVALGMLKDRRGDIKLSVPVSGSVDDPSFGVSSLLMLITKQAVISQAKSYLMQTFVPYATVVSVVISAGEFALKLRFEDLEFKPKEVEIAEDQKVYIDQFVKLLKDKEKTEVKVCGIATPEDVGLDAGSEISNDDLLNSLKFIAKSRSENFKRVVVDVGGLESSRLLLCNPEIDFSKKAQPRISISL